MARGSLDPDAVASWQRIGRDTVITLLGAFMLIWQTAFALTPSPLIVGAGLTLLVGPSALRLDQITQRRGGRE